MNMAVASSTFSTGQESKALALLHEGFKRYGGKPVPETFEPKDEADLAYALQFPMWRICSGFLYKIIAKTEEVDALGEKASIVIPFKPNRSQRRFIKRLWFRNVILKARQLGFTTLISILWLDHALFNANQRCAIIAHTEPDAEVIFRDKVKFAYDNLPDSIREACPLKRDSATELLFAHNNSSVRVAVSVRSGTVHRLHVSELGKISAKFPNKAVEIVTGSFPAVPANGIIVLESTAEGLGGTFHEISNKAEQRNEIDVPLGPAESRFHFFPWFEDDGYRADPKHVIISAADHAYFDQVEGEMDVALDLDQRAWYVAKRDTDFASNPDLMFREFPSSPKEAWRASTEGKYLAQVMAKARKEGRIGAYPLMQHVPINTFWDLGASDDTCLWLHQRLHGMDRFPAFYENAGHGYLHFILWLESLDCVFGTHFLPHDAGNKRQMENVVTTPLAMLQEMRPSWTWQIVPRVSNIQHGIDLMRTDFPSYCFDEVGCKEGIPHLDAYTRERNIRLDCWADTPRHDEHSHAADALRQKAQGYVPGDPSKLTPRKGARKSGMTA